MAHDQWSACLLAVAQGHWAAVAESGSFIQVILLHAGRPDACALIGAAGRLEYLARSRAALTAEQVAGARCATVPECSLREAEVRLPLWGDV